MHLAREVFAAEKNAKMSHSLFRNVPFEITAFFDGVEVVSGLFFHLADDAFRKMAAASEKGVRSARLVISCESVSEEQDEFANEYERLRKAYGRDSRVLEICKEDENRKKLSRVFGRIRQILTDAEERGAR
jgi:hypothetical protein